MSEQAPETTTEHTEAVTPAPSTDMHVGEELGALRARIDTLEGRIDTLTTTQASVAEDVERAEEQADLATDIAINANTSAAEAEQTAEVAEAVAVAAAEVAVEAEQTAEEVEEVVAEEVAPTDDGGEVTEVPAEEESAPEGESEAGRKHRRGRGLYGRR